MYDAAVYPVLKQMINLEMKMDSLSPYPQKDREAIEILKKKRWNIADTIIRAYSKN